MIPENYLQNPLVGHNMLWVPWVAGPNILWSFWPNQPFFPRINNSVSLADTNLRRSTPGLTRNRIVALASPDL